MMEIVDRQMHTVTNTPERSYMYVYTSANRATNRDISLILNL